MVSTKEFIGEGSAEEGKAFGSGEKHKKCTECVYFLAGQPTDIDVRPLGCRVSEACVWEELVEEKDECFKSKKEG
jgi:hypothetical protein